MNQLFAVLMTELAVITPLLWISVKRDEDNRKLLFLFAAYFVLYTVLLFLPIWYPAVKFIKSDWNWTGKIFGITGSALFYMQFKKLLAQHDYVTLKQNNNPFKTKTLILLVLYVVAAAWTFFSIDTSNGTRDYFLFQFTMPGLDEELAFRGIMLGLLSNALQPKLRLGSVHLGNPAILITSLLFGLGHSLQIDANWAIHQNWFECINTFLIGYLLAWMTIRSGSILAPILLHSLINTLPKIIFSAAQ